MACKEYRFLSLEPFFLAEANIVTLKHLFGKKIAIKYSTFSYRNFCPWFPFLEVYCLYQAQGQIISVRLQFDDSCWCFTKMPKSWHSCNLSPLNEISFFFDNKYWFENKSDSANSNFYQSFQNVCNRNNRIQPWILQFLPF